MRNVSSFAVLCWSLLAACSRSEKAPAVGLAASPTAVPVEKRADPKTPVIEDTTFKLALSGEPSYAAGQAGVVKLSLEPRGGYHVNQDYPIRVDLKGPGGLKLQKPSLSRADAAEFGEQVARFELPFTGEQQGAHELTATVDFAVCTKETCVPDQRTVALNVQVK
jgi:hypothetical protein